MALIYLRLPHYIASYLRNIDPDRSMSRWQPFVFDRTDPIFPKLCFLIEPNARMAVNIDCFSQKQWEAMLKGKYLRMPSDGSFIFDMQRRYSTPLTTSEVYLLSGNEERVHRDTDTMALATDDEYLDEYVPIQLPSSIIRNQREVKVYSDWYIPNISTIRTELTDRYKMAFSKFMAEDRRQTHQLDVNRSKMDSIDRFMLRYDIRPSERERERHKKMMQRSENAARLSFNSDEDHGRWSHERTADTAPRCNAPVRILCLDTAEVFPSIGAFARHVGADITNVRHALKLGMRVKGFRIERLDE